jgi:hypothetical protein
MSVDYSAIASNADAMLSEFGQTVTVTTSTAGTYNPATDAVTVTTASKTGNAVILDYDRIDTGVLNMDGSPVLSSDRQCYLSALASDGSSMTEPTPDKTQITDAAGKIYTVKNMKRVSPAGTPVLYELNIRA